MATVIDGVKAPSGGFQQGGWYEGRQYWNGTLSAPGVINSQSNQIGAGQAVSAEVNRATSIAAGKAPDANQRYIAEQTAKLAARSSTQAPIQEIATPFDLGSYLGDYQSNQYNLSAGDLAASLQPKTPAPTPINRAELFAEQKTAMGVDQTEAELNQLKAEERTILANQRANQASEEGKTVALGVMGGRISEEARQAKTELDYLNVRKATLVDELTTKYNSISMFVNYAGLDYQDAKAAYDSEFSKNLQMAQFISGEKQNAITNARANLTTVMNLITSGNMSYDNVSSEEKLQIQKLEIQSGLPVGTMSKLQVAPKDKILGFSDDKTQAMIMDGSGGFKVVTTGLKTSGAVTEAQKKSQVSSEIVIAFNNVKGQDGYVDPQDYKDMRAYWVDKTGLDTSEYDKKFASIYVNPTHPQSYGVSEEYVNPDAFK